MKNSPALKKLTNMYKPFHSVFQLGLLAISCYQQQAYKILKTFLAELLQTVKMNV